MNVHYGCTICLKKSNRERTVINGIEIGIHSRLFPPAYRPAGPFPVDAFGSTKGAIQRRVTVDEHECTAMRSAFIHARLPAGRFISARLPAGRSISG